MLVFCWLKRKPFGSVLEEAKIRVIKSGGDSFDDLLLARQSAIQFGQYRNTTFKWLLKKPSWLLPHGPVWTSAGAWVWQTGLRDAFLQYACTFKQVTESIRVPGRERHVTWLWGWLSDGLWDVREQHLQRDEATDREKMCNTCLCLLWFIYCVCYLFIWFCLTYYNHSYYFIVGLYISCAAMETCSVDHMWSQITS